MTNKNLNIQENNRTVTDFLNKEYKEYTFYVIENRALPSLIDGFKVGARKIMHSAFNGTIKNGGEYKLLILSGDTMRMTLFPHGDTSLNKTIVTIGQDFKYNLNPLEIIGQGGSLRDPESVGAPRYLYIKISKYAKIWKSDYDILDYVNDEGEQLEPTCYLPIIPVVLCQRAQGMAPGYKFSTMSYNPINVIDSCLELLKSHKKDPDITTVISPYVRGINNKKSWKYEEGKWVNYGEFKLDIKKDILEISELPYDMTFKKFDKLLESKLDNGEIKDKKEYLDEKDKIHFTVKLNKGTCLKEYKTKKSESKIWSQYKLKSVLPDDLLWVLDENKHVRHFESPQDVIKYFVPLRLLKYDDRKKKMVKVLDEKIKINDNLVKFIELVCKGKLKIRNRSKKDIKIDMDLYKLPMDLISTPMSKVTIEERDELLKLNESLKKELEYIKKTSTKQMYINDLINLRKDLEKDFI